MSCGWTISVSVKALKSNNIASVIYMMDTCQFHNLFPGVPGVCCWSWGVIDVKSSRCWIPILTLASNQANCWLNLILFFIHWTDCPSQVWSACCCSGVELTVNCVEPWFLSPWLVLHWRVVCCTVGLTHILSSTTGICYSVYWAKVASVKYTR